ncbi:hypothetical protein [Mesorhizobium sp. NZP2077]|uniref:hypothetical protein n=1 Tax=Mesorhizobium sp. NZP2077 TaxID=2483404 RepID=UPI001FEF4206|nr:hypothetical protein [Mesorhizobium sp. NZP2077]
MFLDGVPGARTAAFHEPYKDDPILGGCFHGSTIVTVPDLIRWVGFLGLGIQPPSADWGLAIADGYGFLTGGKWWVVVFNSAAIISLAMATG